MRSPTHVAAIALAIACAWPPAADAQDQPIAIRLTADPNPVAPGGRLTLTVTATNAGTSDQSVVVAFPTMNGDQRRRRVDRYSHLNDSAG
jgi:hypothetical protein